jgi:membrane protein YdbS with pleckstrin-like domain
MSSHCRHPVWETTLDKIVHGKDVGAVADSYLISLLASGEVLLIETRQHWMAAIRYVLRPILLLGAAIALWVLNGWLFSGEGILGTIGDIISWVILIMFVAAIVWLPIDLVRWWSRRYVLTSRRVMRMDGVLRKRSFDSSLEQINDIRTEQSFVGRTLGYADLTIYTASDTANEIYAQLLDGLQFKKAVLESKEALRTGTLLTALPEDFIVKGGTNEASMRADGKLQKEVAAATEPAPDTSGTTTASAGTAAAIAASTVIEPSGEMPAAAELAPVVEPVAALAPAPALVVEPVAEAVVEPVAEVVEPIVEAAEPAVESVAEVAAEDVVEPAVEPVAEVVEPIVEPAAEAAEDVVEAVAEPAAEAAEDVVEAVAEPIVEPAAEAAEDVVELAVEPVAEAAPVAESMDEAVAIDSETDEVKPD